jgi:hypothetical protein
LVERLFAEQSLERPMPLGQLAVVIDGLAHGMLKRRRLGHGVERYRSGIER